MRWSERMLKEGRDIAKEQAEIRKRTWLSVPDAEILLDLKVDAGYDLIRGPWAGFSKLFGERNWRVHRESLEALPVEDLGIAEEDDKGFVRVPRLTYQHLKRDKQQAQKRCAELEKQIESQNAWMHRLVDGLTVAGVVSEVG